MKRLAVATKDGISINLHFGHAKEFWIYEKAGDEIQFLEKRLVDHYCHGQHGDQSAMQKILITIADCEAVFVAKVGDGPIAKLRAVGVEAVAEFAYESIMDALRQYH